MSSEKFDRKTFFASRREVVQGVIWLAVIAVIMYLGVRYIGLESVRGYVDRAGVFGPLVLILMKASTIVFAPISGAPLYLISGAIFGFWKGFLYVYIGDTLGITIAFFISRFFGRRVMRFFVSRAGERYIDSILRHIENWKGLLLAALVFVGIPDIIAYAAGLTRISFWTYLLVMRSLALVGTPLLVAGGVALIENEVAVLIGLAVFSVFAVFGGAYLFRRFTKHSPVGG
jgi:uncharacterized membrane protein YdjX (TVP38/TMEM64 family)